MMAGKMFMSDRKHAGTERMLPVRILSLFLVLVLTAGLTACGGSGDSGKDLDLEEMLTKIQEEESSLPEMETIKASDDNAEINFSVLCDFEYKDVADYIYTYAKDGTASELSIIRLKDASDASYLMSSLKDHIASRRETMRNYSPDQVDMVDSYVLVNEGAYVGLFISQHNGSMQKVFQEFFK
ncbi:MAG: DUF4358 domain-containing protein [Lachnospiraceae bacterium]